MKPSLAICFLLLCLQTGYSQSPFKKGTTSFSNRTNLNFEKYKSRINGDPMEYDFRIDPSYFFIDGFAAGLDFHAGGFSSKNSNSSFNSWQANFTATYGRSITDKINAYIKVFVGPGGSNSEFTNGNAQTLKATYFDVKGLLGAPIALAEGGSAYFTPYFSYDYYKTKTPTNNFTDNTIAFGFKFESYIENGRFATGKKQSIISEEAYVKGSHFIEFNSLGGVSLNKRQQTAVGNTTLFAKQKNNNVFIDLGYNYYVIDNVAVGLNLSYNKSKSGYIGAGSDNVNTSWMIKPVVTAHAPFEGPVHNLFLQAAYGFGVYKQPKKNLSEFDVMAGYNLFLNKFIALTPKIGYAIQKATVPKGVSGIPYTDKGINIELGVRTWLNFWKWK